MIKSLMKVLLILVLALFLAIPVFAGGLQVTSNLLSTSSPTVYVKVRNTSGAGVTLTAGSVVIWDVSSTGQMGVDVTTTTATSNKKVAGVITQSIANNAYGTMIVYGYYKAILVGTAVSVGDSLGTYSTAKYAYPTTTQGAGFATSFDTATDSTTVRGFVHCLGN